MPRIILPERDRPMSRSSTAGRRTLLWAATCFPAMISCSCSFSSSLPSMTAMRQTAARLPQSSLRSMSGSMPCAITPRTSWAARAAPPAAFWKTPCPPAFMWSLSAFWKSRRPVRSRRTRPLSSAASTISCWTVCPMPVGPAGTTSTAPPIPTGSMCWPVLWPRQCRSPAGHWAL